jgi:hypothetical protein
VNRTLVSDSRKPFERRQNRRICFFAEAVTRALISPIRSLFKTDLVCSDNSGRGFGHLGEFVRTTWGIPFRSPKLSGFSIEFADLVFSGILGELVRTSWGKPTTDQPPKFGHLGGFVRTTWGKYAKLFGHLGAIRSGILGGTAIFRVYYRIFEFS